MVSKNIRFKVNSKIYTLFGDYCRKKRLIVQTS